MIVFPNAKINLGLRVLRKRPDGFHDLESAFLPVGLSDILEMVPVAQEHHDIAERFTLTGIQLDTNDDNLCIRALRLLKEKHGIPQVNLHLHKGIPTGSGLGGGSSDAAFTLKAMNEMFSLGLEVPVLQEYASKLGSDCPFFILNQPSLATGRGEVLEPLPLDLSGYSLVLAQTGISIDTALAYGMIRPTPKGQPIKEVLKLAPEEWKGRLVNHFELPVFEKYPEIEAVKRAFYEAGAIYASMTGSGSAVFGLFQGRPELPPALNRLTLHTEHFPLPEV